MGKTFAEKVLARHSGKQGVHAGEIVEVTPRVALSHDNTAAIIGIFKRMGGKRVFNPQMNVIVLDHAAPAPTTKHAENHRIIRDFVTEQGITNFYDVGRGICHQVLVEEGLAVPGEIVLGADSHTPHAGAMGAFGAGIGRSEMASIWAVGTLWLRVPESLKIIVSGKMPAWVTAKDLALKIIGDLGADGALYLSVEWHGNVITEMSLDDRATLPNMAAEMGAKNSFIPPDDKTLAYLQDRVGDDFEPVYPDLDATYRRTVELDAARLEPMIACPHSVDRVRPLSAVAGTKVDQAFLGTCTNGRLEDLATAAAILRERQIAPGTRMIIIPASSSVLQKALELGYVADFLNAGAIVESPGCGPCMGNHLGVPAPGEVTISTANRNFQGRMGTKDSEIYLANPAVAAASAVTGKITHPNSLD